MNQDILILNDFLRIFDEQLYIDANIDLKRAIDEKRMVSAKKHFINHGFYEVQSGKRTLYKNVPLFVEQTYAKSCLNCKELIDSGKYYSIFHHYLLNCKNYLVDSTLMRRIKSVNTFNFQPFYVNFSKNLYKNYHEGRFLKISINVPIHISYRNIKVFAEGKDDNLAFGKKVTSNLILNTDRINDEVLISEHSIEPYFIIDLASKYRIKIIYFEIMNVYMDLKSDVTISISEDNKNWNTIFTNEIELSYARIVDKVKAIKSKLNNESKIIPISLSTINSDSFDSKVIEKKLFDVVVSLTQVLNHSNYAFFYNSNKNVMERLKNIKNKLKSLYLSLPVTLEFSQKKVKPLKLFFKSHQNEIVLCLPKEITKESISLQLLNNDEMVSHQLEKISDKDNNIYKEIIDTAINEYVYWKINGESFNKLIVLNNDENVFWTKKWYIIDLSSLQISYEHGSIVRLYRELLLLVNLLSERNADDLRIIIITMLIESDFRNIFALVRNYQLDQLLKKDIEKLHHDVALVTSKNLFSGKKIFTRHGIHQSILDNDPKRFAEAMNHVSVVFKNDFNLDCIPYYGTLLGIVRDNDFIAHDDDVDMIYIGKSTSFDEMLIERDQIIQKLRSNAYKIVNIFNSGDYNFHLNINGKNIDLFPTFTNNSEISFFSAGRIKTGKVEYFRPLKTIEFYGSKLKLPFNSEKILEIRYGKDWDIPDKNFGFFKKTQKGKYYVF